jgi:L-rhamnose isomerase
VRAAALQHGVDSVAIGKAVGGDCLSRWFADGTNDPAQGSIRTRKQAFEEARRALHQTLGPKQAMLVDYKPFEPAFCSSTPVIITMPRTSSRSSPGSSKRTGSAVSTATTGATPPPT